ncbi:snoRNA-binding protein [Malassezia arunalokei]|uniref:H/ACA ribonucleoprotein complex subunit 2 n=1 Tax=Malassezia arunalokei TaxID=1514897 RepID=A0AAJ5Z581_9BASI|nr:snoRNA-binding protein [Malassezia arunalokei]
MAWHPRGRSRTDENLLEKKKNEGQHRAAVHCSFSAECILVWRPSAPANEILPVMASEEVKQKKAVAAEASVKKEKKEKKDKKEKKKDKKDKKEHATEADDAADVSMVDVADVDVEIDPSTLSPIACPLASEALTKKVYKTIRKASKSRGHVKRGVKEVVKGLRKGEKGLVILAGDISPIDILSHIPVLCEDSGCPYVYVASKDQLGNASSTKRPTSCVMIVPGGGKKAVEKGETKVKEDYQEDYSFLHKEASRLVEQVLMS